MTSRKLHKHFKAINELVFNGCLPKPKILWCYVPEGYLGFCDEKKPGKYNVILSDRMDDECAVATLAHEMIHMWQFEMGLSTAHDKEFRKWARRCKKLLGYSVL